MKPDVILLLVSSVWKHRKNNVIWSEEVKLLHVGSSNKSNTSSIGDSTTEKWPNQEQQNSHGSFFPGIFDVSE